MSISFHYDIVYIRVTWLIYRLLLPVYFVIWLVWFWAFHNARDAIALVYLTYLGVHVFTAYVIVAAINVFWDRMRAHTHGPIHGSDEPRAGLRSFSLDLNTQNDGFRSNNMTDESTSLLAERNRKVTRLIRESGKDGGFPR